MSVDPFTLPLNDTPESNVVLWLIMAADVAFLVLWILRLVCLALQWFRRNVGRNCCAKLPVQNANLHRAVK